MLTLYEFFTQRLLPPAETQSTRQRIAANYGPIGRVDSYQLLAEEGSGAWHIALHTPPAKAKTIIFADPTLFLRAKLAGEFELWDELTSQQRVIKYRGSHIPLKDQELVDSQRFWQEPEEIIYEDKEKIAQALVAEGRNLDDYIIMDTVNYYQLLREYLTPIHEQLKESFEYQGRPEYCIEQIIKVLFDLEVGEIRPGEFGIVSKDLPPINPSLNDLFQTIDISKTKKILKLHAFFYVDDKFIDVIKCYRNLEELELPAPPKHFNRNIVDIIKQLDNLGLLPDKLTVDVFPQGDIHLVPNNQQHSHLLVFPRIKLRELVIYSAPTATTSLDLDLSQVTCKKISIFCKDGSFRLSTLGLPGAVSQVEIGAVSLQSRVIIPSSVERLGTHSLSFVSIDPVRNQKLRSLTRGIGNSSDNQIDFSLFKLEELEIGSGPIPLTSAAYPACLKRLVIHSDFAERTNTICPDLSGLKHLQAVSLSNMSELVLDKFPRQLTSLTVDTPVSVGFREFDVAKKFPELRELYLKGLFNLEKVINIPATAKKIRLLNCGELRILKLDHINQLVSLSVRGFHSLSLNEIVFPQELRYLSLHSRYQDWLDINRVIKNYQVELDKFYNILINPSLSTCDFIIRRIGDTLNLNEIQRLANLAIVNDLEYEATTHQVQLPNSLESLVLRNISQLSKPTLESLTKLKSAPDILGYGFERETFVTAAERDVNASNARSPTALLEVGYGLFPRAEQSVITRDYSQRKIKATLYTKHGVDKRLFRAEVLDTIWSNGTQVTFFSNMADLQAVQPKLNRHAGSATSIQLKKQADQTENLGAGEMEVELSPTLGEARLYIPFVTMHAVTCMEDFIIYTNHQDLQFYWKEATKQVFFALKPGARTQIIRIAYTFKMDVAYVLQVPLTYGTLKPVPGLMDEALQEVLRQAFSSIPQLFPILENPNLSALERLAYLKEYCSGYEDVPTNIDEQETQLNILIYRILHKTGVCGDRAEAFMIFAHYLGIPAAITVNEAHAFGEFPIEIDDHMRIRAYDFGGGERLDLTPLRARGANPFLAKKNDVEDIEDEIPREVVREKKEVKKTKKDQRKEAVTSARQDVEKKKLFSSKQTCKTVLGFLKPDSPRAPLLLLSPDMEPMQVNLAIMQELSRNQFDVVRQHLYIHTPADLKHFITLTRIADGIRILIKGPLLNLLEHGGVLVVNWNHFDDQMLMFKSMLENNGTLMGKPVSKALRIISLLTETSEDVCESFQRRTQRFLLDKSYLASVAVPSHPLTTQEIIECDLFALPNWREKLLGVVNYHGHEIKLHDNGKLIHAIKGGARLRLYNRPADPEFEVLLERAVTERKIYFNGELVLVHAQFNYELLEKEHPLNASNVHVMTVQKEQADAGIYLNANNLHECYQRLFIDNDKEIPVPYPGWFATENHFYITDYISKSEWQELISVASTMPEKQFYFTLLPGAEIEGVAKAAGTPKKVTRSQLIFSNDREFAIKQLIEENSKLKLLPPIDLTPDSRYQHLIAELHEKRDEKGLVAFKYQLQPLLMAMREPGQLIIVNVNGEMNPVLFQQLLPFLFPKTSRIFCNGEFIEIKSPLFLILSSASREYLLASEYAVRDYSLANYRGAFPAEQQPMIDKLHLLFRVAVKLAHSGIGQPEPPQLTYNYLCHLLGVLNSESSRERHHNNPIKGLLHYDYPKHSHNYALLNVLAKYLFIPAEERTQVRIDKIIRLLQKHNIQKRDDVKQYAWELINCCDISTFRNLIKFADDVPMLSDAIIDELGILIARLREHVIPLLQDESESPTKPASEDKVPKQLDLLLKESLFIVLKGPERSKYLVRAVKKTLPGGHFFSGINNIAAWLDASSDLTEPIVLHLKNADMVLPGTWEMFNGLLRQDKTIYYRGKLLALNSPSKKRIIFSKNEAGMAGRYFHSFFQQHAETIYLAPLSDVRINEQLIRPVLTKLKIPKNLQNILAEKLLWAFHRVRKYNPNLDCDMQSLMQRVELLCGQYANYEWVIFEACATEFATAIADAHHRQYFLNALQRKCFTLTSFDARPQGIRKIGNLIIPPSKLYIVNAIEHDLKIADDAGKTGKAYRRGVLLEGASGIGKSSMFKAILEEHGYSRDAKTPDKRYLEVTVDQSGTAEYQLLAAAILGSKIVLDELNLNADLETLLSDLLDGELPTDPKYVAIVKQIVKTESPTVHANFQVFASQNSGTMQGRKAQANALRNQFHIIFADDYSKQDLLDILEYQGVADFEDVVENYLEEKALNPNLINTANLFEWMKTTVTSPSFR